MMNDAEPVRVRAGLASSGLQRALGRLPEGGSERQAIDAGEIDAVIDYGGAKVIVFPAARRALRDAANRAFAADLKAALEIRQGNGVLAALPRAEYRRLLPGLERVTLAFGDVLHEAGAPHSACLLPGQLCCLPVDDDRQPANGRDRFGRS
jgi:hypothetical protein